jgi:DNA replication protein DnaC
MDKQDGQNRKEEPLSPLSGVTNLWGRKIKRICPDCGEEFDVVDFGKATRKYCNKCATKRITQDEEDRKIMALAEKEARYQTLIKQACLPPAWQTVRFENSDGTLYPHAFKRIKGYAEKFTVKSPSLVLYSPDKGTGKTHMAACIVNQVLHQYRYPVMFKKARDLMLDIRRTFSDRGDTEADILDRVLSVNLLVLDDVGVDPPSEWIKSTYWTVFDRRLEWQLPVIVTTNRQIEGDLEHYIGEGAVSRLVGLSRGNVIDMSGDDLR